MFLCGSRWYTLISKGFKLETIKKKKKKKEQFYVIRVQNSKNQTV